MALSREKTIELEYSKLDVYNASLSAMKKLGYIIKTASESTCFIQADVKMNFMSGGCGENLSVSIISVSTGTSQITISSAPKMAYLLAGPKQEKNINTFLEALTNQLQNFQKLEPTKTAIEEDEFEKILKYKRLFDSGVITKEEFEVKKKELLGV